MYLHHGVFHEKQHQNKRKKVLFCNALQATTDEAAGLKFAVSIPITIVELLKKTADQYLLWEQRYGDFKKLTFRRRRSDLFAPTVCAYINICIQYYITMLSHILLYYIYPCHIHGRGGSG
jgi:hypothetical protein